jgi:desulfoferrodoxin-like iron-binding protein
MEQKAGTRLRCETCGSQIIVVKAGDAELACCGKPLAPLVAPAAKPGGSSS